MTGFEMKVQFRGDKNLVGEAKRARADLHVRLLFGRFGDHVGGVTIRLSAATEPMGHPENLCQIVVELRPSTVHTEHTDPELSVALNRAADKAVRSIIRALAQDREQSLVRAGAAARALAASRVMEAARALMPPRTPKAARTLERARVLAAAKVVAAAKTPATARMLESARRLAASLVLETAKALKVRETALLARRRPAW